MTYTYPSAPLNSLYPNAYTLSPRDYRVYPVISWRSCSKDTLLVRIRLQLIIALITLAPVRPSLLDNIDWAQVKEYITFLNKERAAQKEAYKELYMQVKTLLEEKKEGANNILKK